MKKIESVNYFFYYGGNHNFAETIYDLISEQDWEGFKKYLDDKKYSKLLPKSVMICYTDGADEFPELTEETFKQITFWEYENG